VVEPDPHHARGELVDADEGGGERRIADLELDERGRGGELGRELGRVARRLERLERRERL
jgi:hypothetical protein